MSAQDTKKSIQVFFDKMAKLFNHFFPGILILELVFHQGLFSNTPKDIFGFSLFLIWAAILSLPYNFIQPMSIATFTNDLYRKMCEITKTSVTELEKSRETEQNFKDTFETGFIMINLFITYIIFKILLFQSYIDFNLLNISENIILLFVSLIVTHFLKYPVAFIYSKYTRNFLIKYLLKSE